MNFLSILTQSAWNVNTQMSAASSSIIPFKRSRISFAALFVKVMASTLYGGTPKSSIICAILWVSNRVFPLPAPAVTSTAPSVCITGFNCSSLSEFREKLIIFVL